MRFWIVVLKGFLPVRQVLKNRAAMLAPLGQGGKKRRYASVSLISGKD